MWKCQVPDLATDHRVARIDMLGHGLAPDPPGPRTLDDFVEQVHEAIRPACGAEPAVLLGFSMGGLVAQAYALRYGHSLRGLVLMNAVYQRTSAESEAVMGRLANLERNGIEAVIEVAMQRWFRPDERRDHPVAIREMMNWMRDGDLRAKTKAYRVFATSDPQTAGRLGRIPCPALVMTGDGDVGSPPHMSRAMAEQIPAARLEIFDRQQHMMALLDAAAVNRAIREFVGSL